MACVLSFLLHCSLLILLLQVKENSAKNANYTEANFKYLGEWSNWKLRHAKSYSSSLEELERHLIWLSNKRYIDHHNANSHIFGFTLAMNHLGDVVS